MPLDITLTPTSTAASAINDKHREVQRLGRTAKEIAAEIGELLLQVKGEVAHGEFGPWCENNLAFNHASRARYMKVAEAKISQPKNFRRCSSISDVLALGKAKPKAAPQPERRAVTLDDLRKVERLRALRDDPSATKGEKKAAQGKLDEIEKEIGKVEPESRKTRDQAVIRTNAERAAAIILKADVSNHPRIQAAIIEALVNTYGDHPQRLRNMLTDLKQFS